MRWILIIAAAVSLFAGGGAVYASDSASPGDALYGLDRAIESLRLEQAADSLSALKLQLAFAEERLQEAEQLAAEGDVANYELALDEYDAAIQQVASMVGAAEDGNEAALETVLVSGLAEQDSALAQMSPPADEDDDEAEDDDEDLTASKWCTTDDEQHKVGLRLAALHEVNYKEIMGWFCQGAGFGDIKIAYEIYALVDEDEGISVADLFDMFWTEGLEWGDIRLRYGLVGDTHDDDDADDVDDVDDDDDVDADEDGQGNWCVSEDEHPVGGRLAEQFGVDYELIIGWHCQGIGFGEIALALGIAEEVGEETGADPAEFAAELLDEHANGTGWGEIKKAYDVDGKPDKDKPDKPGKPDKDEETDKDKDNPGKAKGHDKDK